MPKYYTLLTKIGEALHANAQITQTSVPWTHMALGDGGGAPVNPKREQTGLVREVHRLPITAIGPHPDNPNWIVVEAVVPNNVGGWTVRETAIMGTAGGAQCIAVGNYPDTYKPVLAEGAVREMVMRMIVEISSTATVNLVIDPAVAIASRQFVEEYVGKELAKQDSKQSARVATTANIALAGLQTIDGIVLAAGDRVLIKDQATAKDNGLYVAAVGAWTRSPDADTSEKLTPEMCVGVEQGTVNGDSLWMLTTDAPITLGVTALTFEVSGGRPLATKSFVAGEFLSYGQSSQLQVWRNSGVFEFVVPDILKSGKKRAKICVRGAGGAGGSPAADWHVLVGGGAGQGGFAAKVIDLTGVNTVTVTVGAGGTPVVGMEGNIGGTSSFGTYCSATGGKVFKWDGADGGEGIGGDINLSGAAGFPPIRHANNDWVIQGRGGNNKQGSAGASVTIQHGTPGKDDGAGGNGGTAVGAKGGAGAAGWVSIDW